MKKIMLVGLGNLLLGDEGLGVQVIQLIERDYDFSPEVLLLDGGTGAFYLLPLLEKASHLLLIDAIKGEKPPGTIHFLAIKELDLKIHEKLSLHEISLVDLLKILEFKGKKFEEIIVAGIEPASLQAGLNLSPEVEANIPKLIELILHQVKLWGANYFLKSKKA